MRIEPVLGPSPARDDQHRRRNARSRGRAASRQSLVCLTGRRLLRAARRRASPPSGQRRGRTSVSGRTHDVIVVGGGFAGVTAAREAALRGRSAILLEARDRLGGRTWRSEWRGSPIEYGGQWVHWHQPHTWSEITRAGLRVTASDDPEVAAWYVDGERRCASSEQRDEIARRGWDAFVDGVREALPRPHDPLYAIDRLAPFDRISIAERLAQLELSDEEREVLTAELESLAHAPLDDAGAVSVLRWHALSGYSLELTQQTGGRVTLDGGTSSLLDAISAGAPVERLLGAPVSAIRHNA